MKTIFRHILVFSLAFCLACGIAYYAIRMFTQSADEVILPRLAGKNIIYVLETLTRMGLNIKLASTQYDDLVPRYSVISQSPEPGATIKKGRNVTIYLSKGKKENVIPDLRLETLSQARMILDKNEFKTGRLSFTYSVTTQKDRIIAQYPEPFATVYKESECDLLISLGPQPEGRVMPDLQNLAIDSAFSIMTRQHLSIATITSTVNAKKAKGLVLAQTPLPGSHVSDLTPISLAVNASKENLTMSPEALNRLILITHLLEPGFLNSHVRVNIQTEELSFELYNEIMKPGENIKILIPSAEKTDIDIFIDHKLVRTITIDPWDQDSYTGDINPWELSPLPFYQPISLDSALN